MRRKDQGQATASKNLNLKLSPKEQDRKEEPRKKAKDIPRIKLTFDDDKDDGTVMRLRKSKTPRSKPPAPLPSQTATTFQQEKQ